MAEDVLAGVGGFGGDEVGLGDEAWVAEGVVAGEGGVGGGDAGVDDADDDAGAWAEEGPGEVSADAVDGGGEGEGRGCGEDQRREQRAAVNGGVDMFGHSFLRLRVRVYHGMGKGQIKSV